MPKRPTSYKEGQILVNIRRTPVRNLLYYEYRFRDPKTKKEIKRRVKNVSPTEARKIAKYLSISMYADRGYLPAPDPTPKVGEGMFAEIQLRNTTQEVVRERRRHAERFLEWLSQNHPSVERWSQFLPSMLQEFATNSLRRGLARDSVRLFMDPVKMGWKRAWQDHPWQMRPVPSIELGEPPPFEIRCLDRPEVGVLLGWLRDKVPDIWPMACLQALAGLRMREAAYLRRQDIDLEARTVQITETPIHRPKTRASWRTIPVCAEVVEALRCAIELRPILSPEKELFVNSLGRVWLRNTLAVRWRKIRRQLAADTGNARFLELPARRLRAAFVTMAAKGGADENILRAYIGHRLPNVMWLHYRKIDFSDMQTIVNIMDKWRWIEMGNDSSDEPDKSFDMKDL